LISGYLSEKSHFPSLLKTLNGEESFSKLIDVFSGSLKLLTNPFFTRSFSKPKSFLSLRRAIIYSLPERATLVINHPLCMNTRGLTKRESSS
jgi:hypothetical protein